MPSWQDEFLGALRERDKVEKAQEAVIGHYTRLADKSAALQNSLGSEQATQDLEVKPASPKPAERKNSKDSKPGTPTGLPSENQASVRKDLAEAQRSRGVIESRLENVVEELRKLKLQSGLDKGQIQELTKEKAGLITGLRDRDEEIKGKTKLLEDVHDETISLTLQLNMADAKSERLENENKDLVDRWMKKMAQEADAMNDESKFS